MRVFITGGSGWIGTAVVDELLGAGHELLALARSHESATALEVKNVEVLRGDLDDPETLRHGALDAEAVVHLANKHNWANTSISNRAERAAVQTIADALVGSDHPFVLASGVPGMVAGRPGAEADRSPFVGPDSPRGGSENLALDYVDRGVRNQRALPTTAKSPLRHSQPTANSAALGDEEHPRLGLQPARVSSSQSGRPV